LETDDYKEIMKKAKALALGIADNFGAGIGAVSGSIGGTPEVSQSIGPVKASFNGSFGLSEDVLGFQEGYKAGVALYFEMAE
jgi:hypothetical protein